jgi:hypothetical protein
MQCANPQCSKELLYLREGRVELLELESHFNDQLRPDDGAFAMKSLPSRFFWLCGECTKTYIAKRWITSGLVLVLRNQGTAGSHPDLATPPTSDSDKRGDRQDVNLPSRSSLLQPWDLSRPALKRTIQSSTFPGALKRSSLHECGSSHQNALNHTTTS